MNRIVIYCRMVQALIVLAGIYLFVMNWFIYRFTNFSLVFLYILLIINFLYYDKTAKEEQL